ASGVFFFFFSSRRRHTRCLSDWSSDVCFPISLKGADQLRQRVAWALTQIFVVSQVDIHLSSWMTRYLQLFDRNAFGNFRQLLYDITLNPAMGQYLNMAGNVKTNVNENYAREVLQLFSIGL